MANTIAHGLVLASAILCSMVLEFILQKKSGKERAGDGPVVAGFLTAVAGIFLAIWQVLPDASTRVTNIYNLNSASFLEAFKNSLFFSGRFFSDGLAVFNPFWATVVIF